MARTYTLRRRAARKDEVRRRIVEAAVVLKQTQDDISMADVAEQAGVGKVTVYRHFGDVDALKRASSQRFFSQNPPPDPSRWAAIASPHARLRAGLAEAHAYHRQTERMMARLKAGEADGGVRDPYRRLWRAGGGVLAAPFGLTGEAAVRLRAAVDLGLSFETWRLLVREQGLSDEQALDLTLRLCAAAAVEQASPIPLSA
ncbi:MAG: TetR/AcrR family transcriptional regulator [Caulobacteraceae bacterium]